VITGAAINRKHEPPFGAVMRVVAISLKDMHIGTF
jgi:hypothetical protein